MVDRFGKPISYGWTPTEQAWLEAIIELGGDEFYLRELAQLTGRTFSAVKQKMGAVLTERYKLQIEARVAAVMATIPVHERRLRQ